MTKQAICRIIGGCLVILIGAGVGFASYFLWNGAPDSWRDVVASTATVKAASRAMVVMAFVLVLSGVLAAANGPWGTTWAAIATVVFIVAAFWANQTLFGSLRLTHTGSNIIVAAVILLLLWVGSGTKT